MASQWFNLIVTWWFMTDVGNSGMNTVQKGWRRKYDAMATLCQIGKPAPHAWKNASKPALGLSAAGQEAARTRRAGRATPPAGGSLSSTGGQTGRAAGIQ